LQRLCRRGSRRRVCIKASYRQITELETKLDQLTELRLDSELTKEEFSAQKKRLKDRQYEIIELMHAYHATDDEFNKGLSYIIEMGGRSAKRIQRFWG
jgi:cytochrome c biogenesis protein ResB